MKKFSLCLFSMMLLLASLSLQATVKSIPDVPYINQVEDMNKNIFLGYNACGPTTAVMMTEFYHLQPENTSGYDGYWVYNSYGSFWQDKSGNNYSVDSGKDWDLIHYVHSIYGAHGQ
jgi:hypothetical protein